MCCKSYSSVLNNKNVVWYLDTEDGPKLERGDFTPSTSGVARVSICQLASTVLFGYGSTNATNHTVAIRDNVPFCILGFNVVNIRDPPAPPAPQRCRRPFKPKPLVGLKIHSPVCKKVSFFLDLEELWDISSSFLQLLSFLFLPEAVLS